MAATSSSSLMDASDSILVANRYGLRDGGRVVVRPDGYIATVTALDDQAGVADYFAQISR